MTLAEQKKPEERGRSTESFSLIILSSIPRSTGEGAFVSMEFFEEVVQVFLSIYRGKANLSLLC